MERTEIPEKQVLHVLLFKQLDSLSEAVGET